MRRHLGRLNAALLSLAVVCAIAALAWKPGHILPAPEDSPQPSAASSPAESRARTGSARAVLETLTVRPDRTTADGYDPDAFAWRADTDHNGCDTRNDVLRRDLERVQIKPGSHGCKVQAGRLHSSYTGSWIDFAVGSKSGVDIDHVVAREDAWQSGASKWTDGQRATFGNDGLNLLAVESSLNRSHGSRTADKWLPPTSAARCAYVSRQVAVKAAYALTITAAERAAMAQVLSTCPGGGKLPTPADSAWPAPVGR